MGLFSRIPSSVDTTRAFCCFDREKDRIKTKKTKKTDKVESYSKAFQEEVKYLKKSFHYFMANVLNGFYEFSVGHITLKEGLPAVQDQPSLNLVCLHLNATNIARNTLLYSNVRFSCKIWCFSSILFKLT